MVLMCHLAACDGGRRSKLKKALDDQVPEEKRYFGFENIGNTCYCNTLLQDWEKLKGSLYWWLKKVLSEYPEAKMTDEKP